MPFSCFVKDLVDGLSTFLKMVIKIDTKQKKVALKAIKYNVIEIIYVTICVCQVHIYVHLYSNDFFKILLHAYNIAANYKYNICIHI